MLDTPQRKQPPHMKLEKLEEKKLGAVDNKLELTILIVSWNLMGGVPSDQNIRRLLSKERRENEIVVIGKDCCKSRNSGMPATPLQLFLLRGEGALVGDTNHPLQRHPPTNNQPGAPGTPHCCFCPQRFVSVCYERSNG